MHAAAIIKARAKGDEWLADRIYSGVPAELVGCRQIIEIGPMSGESNVSYWLQERGYPKAPELVRAIFDHAKSSESVLSEDEVLAICEQKGFSSAA